MNPNNVFISNIFYFKIDKQQMYNQNMMNYNVPVQNPNSNPQISQQMHPNMIPNINPSINVSMSEPPKKERLRLKMTQEEK